MYKNVLKRILCLVLAGMVLAQLAPMKGEAYTFSTNKDSDSVVFIVNEKKGEILTGKFEFFWHKEDLNKELKKYKGKCELNKEEALKKIASQGLNELVIKASSYGALIEPVNGNQIVLSYIGADNKKDVKVASSREKQKLTISVEGDTDRTFYINTSEKERANTIKIGVPRELFKKITLKTSGASVKVSKTGAVIEGNAGNGILTVSEIKADQKVTMKTTNGTIRVEAKNINADISLKTTNGTAQIEADSIYGTIKMETINGDVDLKAKSVSKSVLKAVNGDVTASVERITKDTQASVSNGSLDFKLTKKPENLKLVVPGAKGKNLPDGWSLPSGWRNGHTVGNGEPVLTLKAASNGDLRFRIGN